MIAQNTTKQNFSCKPTGSTQIVETASIVDFGYHFRQHTKTMCLFSLDVSPCTCFVPMSKVPILESNCSQFNNPHTHIAISPLQSSAGTNY